MLIDMAKTKKEDVNDIEVTQETVVKPQRETKQYPLKKATKIGNEIKPIGYKISLTKEGYKFFKQKNIV